MSTCGRRVLVVAHQLGLVEGKDFKFVQVTDFTLIKKPEWLSKQPFGQMPYFEDGDLVLYESRAIAKYLAAKFPKDGLMPAHSDLKAYGLFEQGASVEQCNFDAIVSPMIGEKVFKPMFGRGEPDQAKVDAFAAALAGRLKGYEAMLEKNGGYVAGDHLTIADLFHLTYGSMAVDAGLAPGLVDGSLPLVAKWWKELTGLESWKQANSYMAAH